MCQARRRHFSLTALLQAAHAKDSRHIRTGHALLFVFVFVSSLFMRVCLCLSAHAM